MTAQMTGLDDVLIVGRAHHVAYPFERLAANGAVYALTERGDVLRHDAPITDLGVLYLEGPDERIANWPNQARDHHLALGRPRWHLCVGCIEVPDRHNAVYMIVRWENAEEHAAQELARAAREGREPIQADFIGPLPDIGLVFKKQREWHRQHRPPTEWHAGLLQKLADDMRSAIDIEVFQELLTEYSEKTSE